MGQPGLFYFYFWSFQTDNTIFTTNQYEKCPSIIRRWDSNPWPLEHESLPITIRPGLPPKKLLCTWLITSEDTQTRSWWGVQVWVSKGSASVLQVLMAWSTGVTIGVTVGRTASATVTTGSATTTGASVSAITAMSWGAALATAKRPKRRSCGKLRITFSSKWFKLFCWFGTV